ncbi:NAD(P)H-dependent flavin oxidoreductase YrpB (nitropropane dioxygenase family) [Bacteroides reticulotermitis]|nr:nitronate monooxygenase family protein [Bacteroides reticulotermitis]MBB4045328.1 NAD(P)H-dependent flavin oxidoreductase YrpB (nitropropane dioxygenase family) [Bacteroides reticulotermitis]
MKSFFISNLEVKLPVIQGGMGVGVSLSGLAAAVANEGGIGVISCAGLGLIYHNSQGDYPTKSMFGLKEEIQKARVKSKGIIGVNIMVVLTNYADMVKTSIAEKVDVIFSGAGLPLDLPSFLTKDSKTKLVPIVSSPRAAKIICEKWKMNYNYLPDAIVVEGPKAGGHLGFKADQLDDEQYALEHLVPEVIKITQLYQNEKNIPVIAAGGISSGQDIYDLIKMGASGVQMGTLFVTTTECDASDTFKNVFLKACQKDVKIIQSPVGMPGRAIDGEFIQSMEMGNEMPKSCPFHCIKTCDYSRSPYCIAQCLYQAARGNMKKGYAFTGINVHLSEKISSVKELISNLKLQFSAAELAYSKQLQSGK